MNECKNESRSNFTFWLAMAGNVIALLLNIAAFLNKIEPWFGDPQQAWKTSVAVFIIYLFATLWFAFEARVRPRWQWASIVVLYVITIIWVRTVPPSESPRPQRCTDYDIRIIPPASPIEGEEIEVLGSYAVEPPEDSVVLLFASQDGLYYWPQCIVKIDPASKTWRGPFSMRGTLPIKADAVVAIMGESGRVLFDYYMKVGKETGEWPAMEKLTDDIEKCDRIPVIRTK